MGTGRKRGRTLLALGLTAALLLALNLAGVLRYPGGPLREAYVQEVLWLDLRPAAAGRNGVTALSDAGIRIDDRVLAGIFLPADAPLAATVERVELVGATPGLELVGAWIAEAGVDGPRPGLMPADAATLAEIERAYRPLPAEFAPGGTPNDGTPDDGIIVLELRASAAGSLEFQAVAVDYRMGPFSFRALHGPSLRLCIGPFEDWQVCDWDEEEAAFVQVPARTLPPAHYWG